MRSQRWFLVLVCAHVAAWVFVSALAPSEALDADVSRFAQLASAHGMPYRDYSVEFAPLQMGLIAVLFDAGLAAVAARLAVLSLACGLGIAYLLRNHWGSSAACWFLSFSLPMQVFMPFRIDYVPALLAVAGVVVARRRDSAWAGVLFGVGVGFKIWPGVLAPLFLLGRRRAVIAMGACVILVAVVWVSLGGVAGPRDVVTFRGSTGWQVESTVGASTWIVTNERPRIEGGAVRVGGAEREHLIVLALLAVAVLSLIWWRSLRSTIDKAGFPSLAVVSVLIVLSPVGSPQYLAWVLPWCAIAVASRRSPTLVAAMFATTILASVAFLVYWNLWGGVHELRLVSFARAVAFLGVAIVSVGVSLRVPSREVTAATSG